MNNRLIVILLVLVWTEEKNTFCKNVTQGIGTCVLFILAMGLLFATDFY